MSRSRDAVLIDVRGPGGVAQPGVELLSMAEARRRCGLAESASVIALSLGLRGTGATAVLAYSASDDGTGALHWLDSAHASGWVRSSDRMPASVFAESWSALRLAGHVAADAALLSFASLPQLSWGETAAAGPAAPAAATCPPAGIYAIVDTVDRLQQVLGAGVRTVQLRIKRPADADAAWQRSLRSAVAESLRRVRDVGARLVVNDHWQIAAELGASEVHLGQEDLLLLGDSGRADLAATGLSVGVSSHAVWELCRARTMAPAYVACGPIWPTTTKDMPWQPQGLDNLRWWVRSADASVMAIGGILDAHQVRDCARAGAEGVCVLRGLGTDPGQVVPALQEAFLSGRSERAAALPAAPVLPHPTLESTA